MYIYGTPHLVGCLLGLVALALFFTGIIDRFRFLIVAGCYAIGVLLTPQNRGVVMAMSQQMDADELAVQLRILLDSARNRLTDQVNKPLEEINELIDQILPLIDKRNITADLHTVKNVITQYLPEMLDSYLKLPPAYARFHTLSTGKTPRDELVAQLGILHHELEVILGNLLTDDVHALQAYGKFLEDKYHDSNFWV